MFSSITFSNRLIDVRTNNLIEKDRLTETRECKQQQKKYTTKKSTSKIIATKQKARTQQKSYIEQ